MKKAITLFQHQKWYTIRRMAMMFVLTWGCLGMRVATAQISINYSDTENTVSTHQLNTCDEDGNTPDLLFTDDNTNDGNYGDGRARLDTIEICPKDAWHRVSVSFTDFDLHDGDTLFAYNGNKVEVREKLTIISENGVPPYIKDRARLVGLGSGTGVGVSKAFGGWVSASCDPWINASGCLTFILKTDGSQTKGKGWEAWVSCAKRDITFGDVSIANKVLSSTEKAYTSVTIPAPTVSGCGEEFTVNPGSDSVSLVIRNQFGVVQCDTILSRLNGPSAISPDFAIGSYHAEYTLLSDPTKKLNVPFSVQGPALACNDNVNISLGSACLIQIAPDDILESPSDTIADTMYYNITLTLGAGKNKIVKTTSNFDNQEKVIYPMITADDVRNAGMSICGAKATVTIERIYYQLGGNASIYNNGVNRTSCETQISFSDHSKPYISVPTNLDTLVACDTTGLFGILKPVAIDNCDEDVPVTISVKMEEEDPCYASKGSRDTTKAIITFTAVDDCGNIGTTTREVIVIRPDENKHIVQTSNLTLSCTDESFIGGMPGLQVGFLRNGKFEVRDTIPLNMEEYVCGYILTKKDLEIPTADCGRKLYRYWSVVDWCEPEIGPSIVDTQFIKYTDLTPPSFVDGSGNKQEIELGAFECTYDGNRLTPPTATDDCSTPIVRLDAIFRIEDGEPWPIPVSTYSQLDVDSFHVRWIAEDDCHEQLINDTLMQLVLVKDVTRPTAVCTDQLNISVGSNVSLIDTADIDAGSYDACGIAKREISRDGINFGPTVSFTCADIKQTIQVTYRVTDIHGNTNTCWLNVNPEDKIRPICTAFPSGLSYANGQNLGETDSVSVNCDEAKVAAIQDRNQPTAAELAGIGGPLPSPKDNCIDVQNIELAPVVVQVGFCGQDVYQRRWIARDIWGLESVDTCTQTILIDYVEDWQINLPEDLALTCPMTPSIIDSVTVENGACDKLAVNVETQMFNVVQDACFKVIKTYHIINWCNYVPGSEPTHNFSAENAPEDGILTAEDLSDFTYITYTQVIKVDDNEGPIVIVNEDVDTCIFGAHDGVLESVGDSVACGELKTFTAFAGDCVTEVGGTLSHTYRLYQGTEAEVIAQTAPIVHYSGTPITGNNAEMTAYVLPGTYTTEFTFLDNCGNSTVARQEYTFTECKNPTPYLLNGIAIELSQGWIDVWANDFNQGSYDNCTAQEDLDFRIWHISLGINPPTTLEGVLDSLPTAIRFDCNYLGTQIVRIYVVDESDNYDFASTFVLIQDNRRICQTNEDGENMIAGDITSFNGESIEEVDVRITGSSDYNMTTTADGHYQFMLPSNEDYMVTPTKNDNPLNGVSTFDLVLMSKHILGITPFDSPYKFIAADINQSGTITAFDMVQLRQLILNVQTEFPNNGSWRFVDKNHEFTSNTPLAESFNEAISIHNLDDNYMQTDFVGVKIGDINGNATTNSLLGAEDRNHQAVFNLQLKDRLIKIGDLVQIPINAKEAEAIEGYQFTLEFSGLNFKEIKEGQLGKEYFNTQLAAKGKLMTSWNGSLTRGNKLFTLVFEATATGYLHDFLEVNSEITPAEAYHESGDLMTVGLAFLEEEKDLNFQLAQNAPNPFKEETTIGFTLPEASRITLKIIDVQGKVLKTIQGNFERGYNQVRLNSRDLGATGVLYYQLEAGNYFANKKMIIIE